MQERKQYQKITGNDEETEGDKYTTSKIKDAKELLKGIDELISQENQADRYLQQSAQ